MVDDFVQAMSNIGLRINPSKCAWMIDSHNWDKWQDCKLVFSGIPIGPTKEIKILGSVLSYDANELPAVMHRITQAWKCFAKWQHILMADGTHDMKFCFWKKTVYRSLSWGIQTLRLDACLIKRLAITQRNMVRKFLRLKRHPIVVAGVKIGIEDWLTWQIRSLRKANSEILKRNCDMATLVTNEKASWAGHVARFGLDNKPIHISKYLVAWRNLAWWRQQQFFNDLQWDPIFHVYPYYPKRWENNLPIDWMVDMATSET